MEDSPGDHLPPANNESCGVNQEGVMESEEEYGQNLGRSGSFFEQLFLAVDHRIDVGSGQLEAMTMRNRIGRACFYTVAAKNAAGIIYVIDPSVAFPRRNPLRIGVFRGLDVNTARWAGCRAQKAAYTLFQSAFIPVEDVDAAVTRLEMDWFFGIIFCDGFPQHIAEGYAKAFYQRDDCFASFPDDGRHRIRV